MPASVNVEARFSLFPAWTPSPRMHEALGTYPNFGRVNFQTLSWPQR